MEMSISSWYSANNKYTRYDKEIVSSCLAQGLSSVE